LQSRGSRRWSAFGTARRRRSSLNVMGAKVGIRATPIARGILTAVQSWREADTCTLLRNATR
jgi:hypothetical protein